MELTKRAKDFSGTIIGRLFVKEPAYRKNGNIYWRCVCVCGNERFYTSGNLKQGTLKSCGCLRSNGGKDHKNWSGEGKISKSFFIKFKEQAKRRSIKFEISIEYISNLIEKQCYKCAITGLDIKVPENTKQIYNGLATASIDRIDSNKGYVNGNVQWVHKDINMMKQQYSQDYFIEMCELVTKHNRKL